MSENGTGRLSPAYDVTFTVNYKNRFIGDRHAMMIEESDKLISRSQLLRLAGENDIRNADAIISHISEVLGTFRKKAGEVLIDTFHTDLISNFIVDNTEKLKQDVPLISLKKNQLLTQKFWFQHQILLYKGDYYEKNFNYWCWSCWNFHST